MRWTPDYLRAAQQRTMRLTRVTPPDWAIRGGDDALEAIDDATGEAPAWGVGIPLAYRAMQSPWTYEPVLRPPRPGDDHLVACAYWSPLLHLLTYRFGWPRPDRGLVAWHLAGFPVDDDVALRLISDVWLADGQLDFFAAWLYRLEPTAHQNLELFGQVTGFVADDEEVSRNDGWIDDQIAIAEHDGIHAPCSSGGWDPLHLTGHASGPLHNPRRQISVTHDELAGRAVILAASMLGWYRVLHEVGRALPDGTTIDVIVSPVGHLGAFRRSPETGIWHAGTHEQHLWGI